MGAQAPWRSNAARASLFPAPMPPVIATASGRLGVLGVSLFGCCGWLALGVARAGLVAWTRDMYARYRGRSAEIER